MGWLAPSDGASGVPEPPWASSAQPRTSWFWEHVRAQPAPQRPEAPSFLLFLLPAPFLRTWGHALGLGDSGPMVASPCGELTPQST